MAKKLTLKHEKFCNKYLECGNAYKAYRFAYNCDSMSESTIWNSAYKLLQNGDVGARISYLRQHIAEASGITALQIVNEHKKIAFSNGAKIRKGWMLLKDFEALSEDEKACIRSIETKQVKRMTADGDEIIDEFVKVTTYDKQKSLDALSRMLGFDAPTKVELTPISSSADVHKVIFENFRDE